MFSILIVEKDSEVSNLLLSKYPKKVEVDIIRSIDCILDKFTEKNYDVLIWKTDIAKEADDDGLELLQVISTDCPQTQILIISPQEDYKLAIDSVAAGAYQYLISPINENELFSLLEVSIENQPAVGHNYFLKTEELTRYHNILGVSPQIREIYKQIDQAAQTDISVLISGETGTGKDLVAEALHYNSLRKEKPYIRVNTGAMSPELIASTLFGHVKGAFTGAQEDKSGRFEDADEGSIFLDEIGTMDEKTQIALLRVLENQTFFRTGGKKEIKVDVRIIAATNENLLQAVKENTFREDLFYRFDVFRITIPPLRKRYGDIAYLANHFVSVFSQKYNKSILHIHDSVMKLLENYEWPGNVRELKNSLQRAVLLCQSDEITEDLLPARIASSKNQSKGNLKPGMTLEELEKRYIKLSYEHESNKSKLARSLGISRKSLYDKMKKYEIR